MKMLQRRVTDVTYLVKGLTGIKKKLYHTINSLGSAVKNIDDSNFSFWWPLVINVKVKKEHNYHSTCPSLYLKCFHTLPAARAF